MAHGPNFCNMWLFSKNKDLLILFLPVWVVWIVLFSLPQTILQASPPLWIWVVFILGIDVSHVWSTLFRTYLDKEEYNNHRLILILAPIVSFVLLFAIARESTTYFWRVLAYLAVFHFMKQQYGFFAIYTAKTSIKRPHRIFNDKLVLYFTMLYPLIFWHLNNRDFTWFTTGDFFNSSFLLDGPLRMVFESVYWIAIIGWLIEEYWLVYQGINKWSNGRVLWMLTTLFNWYLGIVWFNSDLAFTITNVVAHGIPYLALIIFYQLKKKSIKTNSRISSTQTAWIIGSIIFFSVILAFSEEYLWDMFLNKEKLSFFGSLLNYPFDSHLSSTMYPFLLTLLSLPQVTHYILDGFIWKMNDANPHVRSILLARNDE
jgi:hypothetical protein